jgi:predicted RNase H-like HicB family nuclease
MYPGKHQGTGSAVNIAPVPFQDTAGACFESTIHGLLCDPFSDDRYERLAVSQVKTWVAKRPYPMHNTAMKFVITIDRDEDGVWVAECPSIPGCVSQGESRGEVEKNIKEAIIACLEVRSERGLPLTVETRSIEVPVAV